jgi:hypothetical protein
VVAVENGNAVVGDENGYEEIGVVTVTENEEIGDADSAIVSNIAIYCSRYWVRNIEIYLLLAEIIAMQYTHGFGYCNGQLQ